MVSLSSEVPRSPELFERFNEINTPFSFAGIFWVRDQVLI
jgi:hypothetical protein